VGIGEDDIIFWLVNLVDLVSTNVVVDLALAHSSVCLARVSVGVKSIVCQIKILEISKTLQIHN
jgi:hypothetical protein